jgi:hypothetical protein
MNSIQTQYKISGLELIYIVLYACIGTTLTGNATFRVDNFLHDPQTRHEISRLGLKSLTRLIKLAMLKSAYIVLYS